MQKPGGDNGAPAEKEKQKRRRIRKKNKEVKNFDDVEEAGGIATGEADAPQLPASGEAPEVLEVKEAETEVRPTPTAEASMQQTYIVQDDDDSAMQH